MEHEPNATAVDAPAPLSAKSSDRILNRWTDLGGPVRLDHGADLHLDARRRNGGQHPSSDHATRRPRLQPGLGNHRRRRVSDGSLQRAARNAMKLRAARDATRYPRRTSRHRGRAAAPAGVALARSPTGNDAAKIGPIARAGASAADKARWAWRGGHLLAQFRVDLSDRNPVHSGRRRAIGASYLQCGCDRNVVRVRICVRALRRISTVGDGPPDGRCRRGAGRHRDSSGRMKAGVAPSGRSQRGSVAGLAGLASPGLRSAASMENVTYVVQPSSRFLALNS